MSYYLLDVSISFIYKKSSLDVLNPTKARPNLINYIFFLMNCEVCGCGFRNEKANKQIPIEVGY